MAKSAAYSGNWGFLNHSAAIAAALMLLASRAVAGNSILYTTQSNSSAPGLPAGVDSFRSDQTWAGDLCFDSDSEPFPYGTEIEWAPVLDPGKDAEVNLTAVSGQTVYNPQPDESGYCAGASCPGQPIACGSDADCGGCGGVCDLAQGPSCSGGSCPSPWTNPQIGNLISCVSDAQCGSCGGTCAALGRSRGDLQMTHPFGFDYDVAVAPDHDYQQLLSRGNVESTHLDLSHDASGQTAIGGFEDIVYPYLHATTPTNRTSEGWCRPDFTHRCFSAQDCPGMVDCEGDINGLGLDPSKLPGTLGMETDHDLIPESYQPHDGDRIAAFGRWIVDCGHGDNSAGIRGWHSEIHPPLLVASGRSTGTGYFGAKCSGDQSCTSLIGRPYLVSQNFGDGAFARHLEHEIEKAGCLEFTGPAISAVVAEQGFANLPDCDLGLDPTCVCNGDVSCIACEVGSCALLDACLAGVPFTCGAPPPTGAPCTTQIEERARINGVPFVSTQDMQYYVQPANGRVNTGDRMLAEWQITARDGIEVALSNAGDGAGVLVDVTMTQNSYKKAALTSKQDWVIDPLAIYPSFSLAGVLDSLFILFVGPIPVAIIDRGLFADRYQAPDAPANDSSPNLIFADKLDPTAQAADIDDSQPFPVSGRINVGWFRCNNGGPYVAECAGASTSVKLSGSGSDPDGNPLTFAWSGGFAGSPVSGQSPSVQFTGTGKFPISLSLDDGRVTTSCDTTVTVQDTTPPTVAITQPVTTPPYVHSATLTLNYTVTDNCTGVKSFTPTMDGSPTLAGHGLQSAQAILLLTELQLGSHKFSINATDNAGNTTTKSVTFTIIVTPDSIKDDVREFLAMGAIKSSGFATALLRILDAASAARAKGDCKTAASEYQAFILAVQAQSGKGITPTAATIMIADAQYLIAHCP